MGCLSEVPSDQERDNGQHETQEVHSEYQETLFTVMVSEHWHRLTGCGVSILVLKICLDMLLTQL